MKWYQSKTLWFNILTAVITLIGLVTDSKLVSPGVMPYIIVFVAFANYILRTYFTSTKIE